MAIHRVRPAYVGLAIAVCLLFSTAALADSNARITRLSYTEGDVRLDRGDGRGFELAVMNMPVAHGNRVWTRNDALAEVEFEDGDTIRLTPETLVILHELSLRSNGTRVSLVELQEGEAYFNLRRDDDNDFRIMVPGGELGLRKSSRLRVSVRGKQLDVAVLKGEVELVGSGERMVVKKGETLNIDPNDPERYFLSRNVDSSSYDEWNKDRESYRDRYANNYNYGSYGGSSYGGYSPYYSYGLSDLNYYGGYFNHPSYGWLWRPYYVNYGWSPFDHGAWVYYPGYGYVWVSAYPWGWIPYRYGSWYYVGGYGWCWRRGHSWDRWSSHTRVHYAPRHFRQPIVPQHKSTGIVNVGRGPRPIFPDTDRGDRGAPGRNRADIRPVDTLNRGGKGFDGRGGITPRLPQAGDPNSEVVGKRSSGQPIVFPSRSGNDDDIRRVETDHSGGISKGRRDTSSGAGSSTDVNRGRSMDRDSGGMNKGRNSASVADDASSEPVQRGRSMDRDSGGSGRKNFGVEGQSNFRDSSSSSGASSSGRSASPSSSPSRSYSPAPSSGSRSSGGSSGSSSRGSSFGGGGSSRGSSGGGSGGASRGSSSGSSSRGTTR